MQDMFTSDEAFDFIKNFLGIENARQRMHDNRKGLLDEISFNISSKIPFQNINLLSVHPSERRRPTLNEIKLDFISGRGGLCFESNIATFYLLSAIGFDVFLLRINVSSTVVFENNHVALLVKNVEKEGDHFHVDISLGHPTLRVISLDFEKESPIYVDSYLEYKFVKVNGKILRMHRAGDMLVKRGKKENSALEFWLDDWRRFLSFEIEGTKDVSEFYEYQEAVYTNAETTPFHRSVRFVTFGGGKASMVVDEKTLIEDDKGQLVSTPLSGGDEGIIQAIKKICPVYPEDLLRKALFHWRQTIANQ